MAGITYSIGLNASQFITGMGSVSSAAKAAGSAVASAGSGMASALGKVGDVLWKLPQQMQSVAGILKGLSLPSTLAGSAETTAVKFRVLIGDAQKAEEVLGRIRAMANSTPFEFPELADAAQKLAAFGESAAAIPEVLRRVGDVSAATGTSVAELAEIYGKARVQGTLFSEDINQLTGRGIPVIQEFAKQLGVTESEIKKLAADGLVSFPMLEKAFSDLTGEGGKFAGMMGAIGETFEGKLSTLSDSFKTLLSEMGKGVNEGLKPVMDELTKQLDGQAGLAKSIGHDIGHGIEVGLEVLKSGKVGLVLAAAFDVAVNRLKDGLKGVMNFIIDEFPNILNPVEMGERLAKRQMEKAITPVGRSVDGPIVSNATREAEARLADLLKEPEKTVASRHADDQKKAVAADAAKDAADAKREAASISAAAEAQWQANDQAGEIYLNRFAQTQGPEKKDGGPYRSKGPDFGDESGKRRALMTQLYGAEAAPPPPPREPAAAAPPDIGGGIANAAAGTSGEGGRKRIRGAILPGSFQYNNKGQKVALAPGAEQLDRHTGRAQDRQSRRAGKAGSQSRQESGDQREQQRDAMFKKLYEAVQEIEKKIKNPAPAPAPA